jgi:hypothetical protein
VGARSSRAALIFLVFLGWMEGTGHGAEGRPQGDSAARPLHGEPARPANAHRYALVCGDTLTVWRRVRDPGTASACALVVRARASLWTRPTRAAEEAVRALALAPQSLEAVTTRAAASHVSGNFEEAHRLFLQAETGASRDDWAALPGSTQLVAARAASLAGFRSEALEHYRAVVLALDRIERPHERARVLLEAALLAARESPPSMAEALAYFHQASGHPSPRLTVVRFLVGRALGLSTDRDGGTGAELEEAWEQLRWMRGGAPPARGAPGELLPVLPPELMSEILPPAQADAEAIEAGDLGSADEEH